MFYLIQIVSFFFFCFFVFLFLSPLCILKWLVTLNLEKQTNDCLTVLEKHGITTKLFGNVKAAVTPKFKGFTLSVTRDSTIPLSLLQVLQN